MKRFLILTEKNNGGSRYSPNNHFICAEFDSEDEAKIFLADFKKKYLDAYIHDVLSTALGDEPD